MIDDVLSHDRIFGYVAVKEGEKSEGEKKPEQA